MVKILQLLSMTSAAVATSDYASDDVTSMMQAKHGVTDASRMCVPVRKGDVAPIQGSFNGRQVEIGEVAEASGTFCVDKDVYALVERSSASSSAQDVDMALASKSPSPTTAPTSTEKSVSQKGTQVGKKNPAVKANYNDVGYPDMGNEAAIVGDGGVVLRYIDDSWVRQDYGPQCQNCKEKKGDLLGVGFPDEGKGIRAVGRKGLWLEFKPSADATTGTWEQEVQWVGLSDAEKTTLAGIDLHAVQFPDGGVEIMAVGTDGYVLRWLGAKWKLEKVGSGTLKAIAYPDEGDGYGCLVAGSDGEVYMQMGSNDAATWEKQTVPAGPNGEVCDFEDVRYDQDQNVGAGYAIAAGSKGLVYQIAPTKMDKDLVPIAPTKITLLKQFDFTVYTMQYQGAKDIKIAGSGGNIWEFTSGAWKETAESRKLTQKNIYRAFLSDQGDVLSFVGEEGTILRWSSGQFVNAEYEDHGTNLESVAFPDEGGEAIAVGHAGTILEVKNDIWKAAHGTTDKTLTSHHLKCVAFQDKGSNAIVVGMGGTVLERKDGKWSKALHSAAGYSHNLNGCAFGESDAGNPFVAVGDGGHVLTRNGNNAWQMATIGTCDNNTPCNLNAVAYNDAGTKRVAVGAGGKIWMQSDTGNWQSVDSPTTKDLYAIAFKDNEDLNEAIIVGAEGTALVYGLPVADKWNLYCKGVLKGAPPGDTCVAEGPWATVTEDLKSVSYLDAEKDDDPVKKIAIIAGNKGTLIQFGFNGGNRNFDVMKENKRTDKDLNSIAVSDKGALVFVVGDGNDVDGEDPEATIIRKTGKEIWSPESLKSLLQQMN